MLSTSAFVTLGLLSGRLPSLLLFFEQEGFGVDVRQYFVGFMDVEMAAFKCRPHQPLLLGRQRRTGAGSTCAITGAGAEYVSAGAGKVRSLELVSHG